MMKLFTEYQGLRKEMYILFFSKIITSLGSMIWSMLTIILTNNLGLSVETAANWMIIYSLSCIPLQYFGGIMADKLNKKNVIIITDFIEVIIYLYCFFTPFTKSSMIICLIACSLENFSGPAYDVLCTEITETKDRERANSLLYLGMNIGFILAPILSSFLVNYNVNLIFLITGLTTLIALTIEFLFLKDISLVSNENIYEKPVEKESLFFVLIENKVICFFIIICTLEYLVYAQYNILLPLDLVQIYGEKGTIIYGVLSSVNSFTVLICTSLITRWFVSIMDMKKYNIGLFFMLMGYAIFIFKVDLIYMCFIAIFIFTIGEIFMTISCIPALTRRIPSSHRGRILSFMNIFSTFITSIGQKVISHIYETLSSFSAWLIVLLINCIIFIAMFILRIYDKKKFSELYK